VLHSNVASKCGEWWCLWWVLWHTLFDLIWDYHQMFLWPIIPMGQIIICHYLCAAPTSPTICVLHQPVLCNIWYRDYYYSSDYLFTIWCSIIHHVVVISFSWIKLLLHGYYTYRFILVHPFKGVGFVAPLPRLILLIGLFVYYLV
jgi:hypothetical protein